MDRLERIYKLHQILRARRTPIGEADLKERLGDCSRATLYRTVAELRDHLHAPIVQERERGWRYDKTLNDSFELPGLWFNASEIHALLAFRNLLHNIQPGLLDEEIEPLRARIEQLVAGRAGSSELERRVRILGMAAREPGLHFQACASALVERKRLHVTYHSRSKDEQSERKVSPQRLVHYRDNWYLDAWCHTSRGLRTFAVDRIRSARILDKPAREIPDKRLDRHFADSYGIFAGKRRHTAVLRFTPERARWVADEQWHPQQKGHFLDDGRYELHIPYGDARELILDILKHGAGVKVAGPPELLEAVRAELEHASGQYR